MTKHAEDHLAGQLICNDVLDVGLACPKAKDKQILLAVGVALVEELEEGAIHEEDRGEVHGKGGEHEYPHRCHRGEGNGIHRRPETVERSVLNDFCAEVGTVDCTQVLLVRLPVGTVLVKHVWGTSFHLCLEDAEPELLRFDRLMPLAISLKLHAGLLKFVTPDINEPLAGLRIMCFVGAEKRPARIICWPCA